MHVLSCENEFYLHENEKSFPYQRLSMHLASFFWLGGTRKWPILSLFSFYVSVLLACSSDIFCGCANVFPCESTMLKLQKRGKSKGGGRGRPHTYRKVYYFYSPQSSTVIKSKMAATTRTTFRPPKIG